MTDNDKTSYNEIVLGAWLHDVGKFAQRAGKDCYCSKDLEGQLCRLQKGGFYSHQHVLYTEGFLQKFKDCLPGEVNATRVIRLASAHHNPSSRDEWLIAHGDRLSSGADRCSHLLENIQDENKEIVKFYEKKLTHLLSTVHIHEKQEPRMGYTNLKALNGKAIFADPDKKTSKEQYQELWEEFEKDFTALKGLPLMEFMRALDTLAEQYWWCIPSATNDDADVSLYQHAKTTAAFAGTLYRWYEANDHLDGTELEAGVSQFLFVNGDISGIQRYIFDLKTTDQNAKLLRARSFQIWALGKIIAEYICEKAGVSPVNILNGAGGRFLLVLPGTEEIRRILPELRLELETYFVKEFGGKLFFILSDGIEACSSDLHLKNAKVLFAKIRREAERAKQKKLQAYIETHGAVLTERFEELQKYGECSCCETLPSPDPGGMCKNCEKLIETGTKLVKEGYKILLEPSPLGHFGEMVRFVKEGDPGFGYTTQYVPGKPLMDLPYTVPLDKNGDPLLFEKIAKLSTGTDKIAMFKADIDNLGLVFSSSLGDRVSFSRHADLSRKLHYFFSGFYAEFVHSTPEYDGKIYTVFSGGDDLCVLGAWDTVIRFASEFRKKLDAFTNKNPSITLSGGIAFGSPSLPVRNIAAEAEEALEAAKKRKDQAGNPVKDGITVFGVTVGWAEFDECLANAEKIIQYIRDRKVSSGMVYKMIDFANRAARVERGNVRDLLWISNFRYMMARNIKDDVVRDRFLGFGTPEAIRKSRIAVSYALYANRKGEEENNA